MRSQSEFFGVFITLLGGVLWGFSGVCGQYLFTQKGVSADWLVPYRLSLAGLAMVAYYVVRSPRLALAPLKDRALLPQLLIYAIFGLMMTQYAYFYSIELSNAAVATVIQYSAPALILAVVCFLERRAPKKVELIALILAVLGVVLLATHGDLGSLVISAEALVWCLISALGVVIYSLIPTKLNQKYPVALNLGWGMVIGGGALALYTQVWQLKGVSYADGFAALAAVVILGTICAFSFYMTGLKMIGASRASMIACIEPVSAAAFAYFGWGRSSYFLILRALRSLSRAYFCWPKIGKRRKFGGEMIYLAQTDTTAGFLSKDFREINALKRRAADKPCLITTAKLSELKNLARVPAKFKNLVRRTRKTTFLYPNAKAVRVVKGCAHEEFLRQFDWLYSSSANLNGQNFDETWAKGAADQVVDQNFSQNASSKIYKISKTKILRIR